MTGDREDGSTSPVRVSVIVPVFNPGPGFDDLIASFDRQTLDPRRFEVILCDDGSDEATQDRLRRVARTRPHVRVLTLAHTGWPGTPRNRGIEAALGRYVFFSDQDDRLFDGALEHLSDYADANASDVVVGKVVGIGRRIPRRMFRRDVPHAVLGEDPLLELLTPHKLFRTAFLREHGIRFPDGRVRLEDHLFVMEAYFRADTISILASEPCYAWLKNKGSASSRRIDPVTYFPHLETVLDLVEANTEPGELRDTLLRHWYRGKVLKRLDPQRIARYPADYRARFFDVVIPLTRTRFAPSVDRGLPFPLRVRSTLLRAGLRDEIVRFAAFESALDCGVEATRASWTRGGRLTLALRVRVVDGAGEELRFEPAADQPGDSPRMRWRPPAGLGIDDLPVDLPDAGPDVFKDRVELLLCEEGGERRIASRPARDARSAPITLDPLKVFSRTDSSLGGELRARVHRAGWTFDVPVRAASAVVKDAGRPPLRAGRRCALVVSDDGTVGLTREWPAGRVKDLAARAVRRAGSTARPLIDRSLELARKPRG